MPDACPSSTSTRCWCGPTAPSPSTPSSSCVDGSAIRRDVRRTPVPTGMADGRRALLLDPQVEPRAHPPAASPTPIRVEAAKGCAAGPVVAAYALTDREDLLVRGAAPAGRGWRRFA